MTLSELITYIIIYEVARNDTSMKNRYLLYYNTIAIIISYMHAYNIIIIICIISRDGNLIIFCGFRSQNISGISLKNGFSRTVLKPLSNLKVFVLFFKTGFE